jgi:hypothetical protein
MLEHGIVTIMAWHGMARPYRSFFTVIRNLLYHYAALCKIATNIYQAVNHDHKVCQSINIINTAFSILLQFDSLNFYYKFVLIAIYIVMAIVETTRLYLGYIGNLQEKVYKKQPNCNTNILECLSSLFLYTQSSIMWN